jgi:hypothetical protein
MRVWTVARSPSRVTAPIDSNMTSSPIVMTWFEKFNDFGTNAFSVAGPSGARRVTDVRAGSAFLVP